MIKGDGMVRGALVLENIANYYGGGIMLNGGGYVGHATIMRNTATSQRGGGVHCNGGGMLVNSIIYNNYAGAGDANFFDEAGGGYYDHCCIPTTPGNQNSTINNNPGLLTSTYYDCRPNPPTSPMIDAGADIWGPG